MSVLCVRLRSRHRHRFGGRPFAGRIGLYDFAEYAFGFSACIGSVAGGLRVLYGAFGPVARRGGETVCASAEPAGSEGYGGSCVCSADRHDPMVPARAVQPDLSRLSGNRAAKRDRMCGNGDGSGDVPLPLSVAHDCGYSQIYLHGRLSRRANEDHDSGVAYRSVDRLGQYFGFV